MELRITPAFKFSNQKTTFGWLFGCGKLGNITCGKVVEKYYNISNVYTLTEEKRMTTFYKQNENGEYVEADQDVESLFHERSDKIVSHKIKTAKEKLRAEIEDEVRKDALETIKGEVTAELETGYKEKLEASESRARQLDIKLRRKTIAAEYGFKPEAEEFLGDGSDDEMRAKADTLKTSFTPEKQMSVEKTTTPQVSKMQQKTGITVEI